MTTFDQEFISAFVELQIHPQPLGFEKFTRQLVDIQEKDNHLKLQNDLIQY